MVTKMEHDQWKEVYVNMCNFSTTNSPWEMQNNLISIKVSRDYFHSFFETLTNNIFFPPWIL